MSGNTATGRWHRVRHGLTRRLLGRPRPPGDWPALSEQLEAEELAGVLVDVYGAALVSRLASPTPIPGPAGAQSWLACPGAAAGLEGLRARGARIVFVSEAPLAGDAVRATLEEHGLWHDGDALSVSSAIGATTNGEASFLRRVLEEHDLDAARTIYVGDGFPAELARASRAGLRSVAFRPARLTRHERAMAARPEGPGPAIAGAARLSRLGHRAEGAGVEGTMSTVGAEVGGQALVAFLVWVREQCLAEGVRHVAFVARDGEVMLRLAGAMPADYWGDFDLSYLHANRTSWQLGSIDAIGLERWLELAFSGNVATLNHGLHRFPLTRALNRVGLDAEDCRAGSTALKSHDPSRPLPTRLSDDWKRLFDEPRVRDKIRRRARERHELILEHLQDIGLPQERIALVDVGWRGTFAWTLSSILRRACGHEPMHLHLGGLFVVPLHDVDIRRFAYDDSVRPQPHLGLTNAIEVFTGSDKPRVVGYERGPSGRAVPVFASGDQEVDTLARGSLQEGILDVGRRLPSLAELRRWGCDPTLPLIEETRRVVQLFWTRPGLEVARAFEHLLFEADDAGKANYPAAKAFRITDLRPSTRDRVHVWPEGSLRLTPQPLRSLAALAIRIGRWRNSRALEPAPSWRVRLREGLLDLQA